ncbi:MAG: GNAT family N-acetyltransferase [Proteobacteria bacterium]|nr:GNAT family N-acetyltransferase [Pseudomonadota bacterium]
MQIREARDEDFEGIWPIFRAVVSAGDTYAIDVATTEAEARTLWMAKPRKTYVAVDGEQILGTYTLKTNQPGPGAHVCNCGYMVAEAARGQGVASRMCEHSQRMAVELGYLAMQFNLVLASNAGAVRLWHRLGFVTVGTIPGAYRHPELGLVDAFVMHKWLAD